MIRMVDIFESISSDAWLAKLLDSFPNEESGHPLDEQGPQFYHPCPDCKFLGRHFADTPIQILVNGPHKKNYDLWIHRGTGLIVRWDDDREDHEDTSQALSIDMIVSGRIRLDVNNPFHVALKLARKKGLTQK